MVRHASWSPWRLSDLRHFENFFSLSIMYIYQPAPGIHIVCLRRRVESIRSNPTRLLLYINKAGIQRYISSLLLLRIFLGFLVDFP